MSAPLIFTKIPAIMASIDAIGKNRKNQSQGYAFRGIDDMYNELHSHFATHKVFYTPEVLTTHREEKATKSGGLMQYVVLTVKYTFYAEDGSSVSCTMIGEASDSGDKASNKAMSTALKYALMEIFLIPTEDEKDTETNSPQFVAPKITLKGKAPEATMTVVETTAPKSPETPNPQNTLEWLNPGTPNWDSIKTRMKDGMKMEDVKKFFKLSKANETKLLNEK
jgi:hypothetical protein